MSHILLLLIDLLLLKAGLIIRSVETILPRLGIDLLVREEREFLARADVRHVLHESFGEDEVDFLETAVGGFDVEEVDNGDEGGVDGCEAAEGVLVLFRASMVEAGLDRTYKR